jgi:hypothetical protein
MNLITLADRLGKTISEIEEVSIDEINEWVAYFKVEKERDKRGGGKQT